tara:strand:- start:137 stop:1069 length:933 start_codon:yes stop_codon:yes gene_type:complete
MTVLLIGGAGFVGKTLVEFLARNNYKIIILSRNAQRGNKLKHLGDVGQITSISGDATDYSLLNELISRCNIVINLVGILSQTKKQSFKKIHSELPEKIASICNKNNIRKLIHFSSLGVSLNSDSIYSKTKAEGEKRLLKNFKKAIIFRPSIIFGPGDGFFCRFAQMAMFSPALPLIGGGKNKFQPVYIKDLVKAVVRSLTLKEVEGKIFEIGGPKIYTFKELLELVLLSIERKRPLVFIPFSFLFLPVRILDFLPNPPLTSDQLRLLKYDNICSNKRPGLEFFSIIATKPEHVVKDFLVSFRPGGKFRLG